MVAAHGIAAIAPDSTRVTLRFSFAGLLGRVAAWYGMDKLTGAQIPGFLATLERLGYDTLWYPESRGYESFAVAGFMLGQTTKLKKFMFPRIIKEADWVVSMAKLKTHHWAGVTLAPTEPICKT